MRRGARANERQMERLVGRVMDRSIARLLSTEGGELDRILTRRIGEALEQRIDSIIQGTVDRLNDRIINELSNALFERMVGNAAVARDNNGNDSEAESDSHHALIERSRRNRRDSEADSDSHSPVFAAFGNDESDEEDVNAMDEANTGEVNNNALDEVRAAAGAAALQRLVQLDDEDDSVQEIRRGV
jgi:hypothetical protein